MRGRALRYTQSETAWYAIVIGDVEQNFTIEQPGIASHGIDVLGAEVVHTQEHDGLLTLFLKNQ